MRATCSLAAAMVVGGGALGLLRIVWAASPKLFYVCPSYKPSKFRRETPIVSSAVVVAPRDAAQL